MIKIRARSDKIFQELVRDGRADTVDWTNRIIAHQACIDILNGRQVDGVVTVADTCSFKNAAGDGITPMQATEEAGQLYIGISSQPD
jgi:hypothetical protein